MTLDQLSEVSGVNRGTIHRIELDQVSPRLDTLELLCHALGTDLPGFFGAPLEGEGANTGLESCTSVGEAGPSRGFREGILDWLGHLEALFHHSSDGLAVVDSEGKVCFESCASMRLRGETSEGRLAHPWYHTACDEDRPALEAAMSELLQRPETPRTLEYRVPSGADGRRWVRATLRNQMAHPAIQGIVLNLQDITDWKAAEAQRWRLQMLETQLQVVKALTAEFSNLWMGLQGQLDVARLGGQELGQLPGLQENLDRASRLLHQMRDLCGHPVLDSKPLDLNLLLREQGAARARQGQGTGSIVLDLDPTLPTLVGDRELLARMVNHLLDHLKLAAKWNGPIRVTTVCRQFAPGQTPAPSGAGDLSAGSYAVIEFYVPGDIRPASHGLAGLETLFTTGLPGASLSLSAALRTVRDHGGVMEESHGPEGGTRLRVLLPIRALPDSAPAPSAHADGAILVVDDEEFILSALCEMLSVLGHRTLAARNGQEALDLYRRNEKGIRLVLLDVNMPSMGGGLVLQQLRKQDPEVQVVLCTGTALDHEPRYEGIAGILRKPFRYEDLRDVVQELLA